MLPAHRPPPALEHLARLNKSSNPFGKFLTRWILLGLSLVFVFLFAGPAISDFIWAPPEFSEFPPAPGMHPHKRPPMKRPPPTPEEQRVWDTKKVEVRDTFMHAWKGYKTRAFPNDELSTVTGAKTNRFNGWSVTLFDSLSTMWIMNLRDEFAEAVKSVKGQRFDSAKPSPDVPFFETVIRYLGGTLSAYALSGDENILRLADDLGKVLVPAFNGTKTGLPTFSVNVQNGNINQGGSCLFAEATSCQLEFKYLAKLTSKKEYYQGAQRAMEVFYKENPPNGLFAERYNTEDGTPISTHYTVGATSDSGYEYFLKQWILSGDEQAREQYRKSANGIIKNLIHITPNRGLMYVGIMDRDNISPIFEHLVCFLPGTLMLGVTVLDLTPEERELHEWAAHGLAYTCYISYADQATGLGPERLAMVPGERWVDKIAEWRAQGGHGPPPGILESGPQSDKDRRDYTNLDGRYLLRPETVESLFYMWRITGDPKWRDRAYEIYQAIEKYTRTELGYASVNNVDSTTGGNMDEMPSFFLAETLKYLYLIFDDVDNISLNRWVFNTEAHPLPMLFWTEKERQTLGISP
ncbi:seven-hairpin glycosidase [Pholiota conissans]|uniref:alpha-1,2-Mannosidase n=1 Tax=Pholiota conissans TaxID=109636 RepID=A0A9P5YSU5_9AGAR|nr:seven-hairpin glycosidase [Pholiota conissans]